MVIWAYECDMCDLTAARVQKRIRRNKKCLAYAYHGICFLQRLISGSMRSLTANKQRVCEVDDWKQMKGGWEKGVARSTRGSVCIMTQSISGAVTHCT